MSDLTEVFGQNGFDVSTVEPSTDQHELIPAGWVTVGINTAELKVTNNEQGQYIGVDFILIGEFQNGRHIFENYNIQNPNQKAMEIAYRDLSALGRAINVPVIQNTDQLAGRELMIRIVIKKNKKSGEMENNVGAYAPLGTHPEQVAKNTQNSAPVQQQAATTGAPAQQPYNQGGDAPPVTQQQPPQQAAAPAGRPWEK